MNCPFCDSKNSKVLDSRSSNEGRVIRRRRQCQTCKQRFTTKEFVEEVPLMVIKDDNRREVFDREKVRLGLLLACKKRPVSVESIEGLVDNIELKIRDRHVYEVKSTDIGKMVMSELRGIDEIAYIRFASVYHNFQDKTEFINALRDLDY
ncbi:MAG: transcriptional repressor NrdR [Deferribacteres bacterium]|nr:transcriptional repressor NrdR [candidate division KSB1 bacterium]MCB9502669.1 transcriptional repressor NrdR [Deferribacteres bacterium]